MGTNKEIVPKKLKLITLDLKDYKKLLFLKSFHKKSEMNIIRQAIRNMYEQSKRF